MATGSQVLLSLRGALGASEGAATTPTRFLYPGVPENVDLGGIKALTAIEDRRAWNKADQLADILNGIEDNGVTISPFPASTEDLGFYLSTAVGVVSGAGQGAGTPTTTDTSAYTRVFKPSQTAYAYGATGGYDLHLQVGPTDFIGTLGWSIPGLRLTDFTLDFHKRASGTDTGVLFGGTWQTNKTATDITAFTGSLSDRTQTFLTGNMFKAYVDTSTMGSTADTNVTSGAFTFARPPSWHDGADGTGLHTEMLFPMPMASGLQMVRKFANTTEYAAFKAKTLRKVRLICEGALVGAATALATIQLDFVGKLVTHQATWVDGILYANLGYQGVYDSTLGASWAVTTINTVSAAYTTA